jgi:aminoglycoside 6'-N-acetyltransferase I
MSTIRQAEKSDGDAIARMMNLLWPESSIEEFGAELDTFVNGQRPGTLPSTILVACDETGALTGFIEVGLRSHADGCDATHPVGFVEGWFVHEELRGRGIGRDLVRAAEDWARSHGCREMASDAWIDHEGSQHAHQALGFEVVDRCVHFRKSL